MYYSGKKKKHTTVKNLYTADRKGLIVYKTRHNQMSKRHDYHIYKKNHLDLPEDVMSMYDLGFLGVGRKRLSEVKIITAYQKGERMWTYCTRKGVQSQSFCKKNSNRTCYLQVKEIQDNE